ncbi:FbpB family small basic protein [Lentibacillus saliphilus]
MHPKYKTFQELVDENRNALLQDENELDKIEIRLEKKAANDMQDR